MTILWILGILLVLLVAVTVWCICTVGGRADDWAEEQYRRLRREAEEKC
jgi:hypothetical protein